MDSVYSGGVGLRPYVTPTFAARIFYDAVLMPVSLGSIPQMLCVNGVGATYSPLQLHSLRT